MNSTSTQYVTSRTGIFEPIHQFSMWTDFRDNGYQDASATMIIEVDTKLDNQSEDTSQGMIGPSNQYEQEASKPVNKVLRRLAQNREAARKSRLRKKAYVQQLETSRLKLVQLEQELEQTRQQNAYIGGGADGSHLGYSGTANSGTAAFKIAYGQWVEEQTRQTIEMRTALQSQLTTDMELHMLVDGGMNHYFDLFRMKATAAKADVFYLMSGMWKTPTERFFMWIGGFRPSELVTILEPHLDLSDQHLMELHSLRLSCHQTEDALSQGMEKLKETLADTVALGLLEEGSYFPHMSTNAMERLEALVPVVNQADHIRQETLKQILRILTIRQAATGLLVLGEYFQSLRDLSSLWATRHHEPS